MENIKTGLKTLEKPSIYRKILLSLFHRFKIGTLRLRLPDGEEQVIGNGNGLEVDLTIHNENFFKRCTWYGDIGFAESFMDGEWSTSDLTKLLKFVIQNIEDSGVMSGSKAKSNFGYNILKKMNRVKHLFNRNDKEGSSNNISYHYDISNDFYELMLDETMMYSCAFFENDSVSLQQAQEKKLQNICDDLDIQPGDHILEVGCGWGGFAIYATTHYDCKVTGITISKEQFHFAKEKVRRFGLEDKINIIMKDYRDLEGQFDKVVSIEMIEAVGDEFLPTYFKSIDRLLKKSGVAVIQAITAPDSRYEEFKNGVDFIQKHIFPGSLLPSTTAMLKACEKDTVLQLHKLHDQGPHYAKTLRLWKDAVDSQKEKIRSLGMDEKFFRMWDYYLCYCEAAFIERNISNVQVTFIKPNNTQYQGILEY